MTGVSGFVGIGAAVAVAVMLIGATPSLAGFCTEVLDVSMFVVADTVVVFADEIKAVVPGFCAKTFVETTLFVELVVVTMFVLAAVSSDVAPLFLLQQLLMQPPMMRNIANNVMIQNVLFTPSGTRRLLAGGGIRGGTEGGTRGGEGGIGIIICLFCSGYFQAHS